MSVKIRDIINTLEQFAPLPLQESYDNAGLQIGLTEAEVSGVLLCLDVTEEVLHEALDLGCNLIVSHHPLLFRGLKRVSDTTMVERCVRLAVKHDLAIYSAHTNLDNAQDGVNYRMAQKLGLEDAELVDARPVQVMQAGSQRTVMAGNGVVGSLTSEEDALSFLQRVKQTFKVECLMHNELLARPVQSVMICGGAGDSLLERALKMQVDVFLTGEMHYHLYMGHEQEIQIGVLGHYQSEQYTTEIFMELIEEHFPQLPIYPSECVQNPIKYLF